MAWYNFIFGTRNSSARKQERTLLRCTSHRGDEWWCEDASAQFGSGNFRVESFGRFVTPLLALELIRNAREAFPEATIDIALGDKTGPIVRQLNLEGLLVSQEIQLSPQTRVARVEEIKPNATKR